MRLSELKKAVPYRGIDAGFARRVLIAELNKSQFKTLTNHNLHLYFYLRWRNQLKSVAEQFHKTYSHLRYTRALNCASSLLFLPRCETYQCGLRWVCPFCYARRSLELWRFIAAQDFKIGYDVMGFELNNDLQQTWHQIDNITLSYGRHHDGLIVWRQFLPLTRGTAIRLFQLWPAEEAVEKKMLYRQLSRDLSYPMEWLLCEPARMISLMHLIKTKRCFATFGSYRKGNV